MEAALLAAVLASPDDDAPRLVYADALQQRGDARGEFIALQCELARKSDPALKARADALLERHRAEWVQPFMGDRHTTEIAGRKYTRTTPTSWDFHRGFVRGATMAAESFSRLSAGLFAREPVQRVHLTGRDERAFAAHGIEQLREFDLSNTRFKDAARTLFSSKRFSALEVLELRKCGLGVKGMTAMGLADPKHWPRLRHLGLAENALKDAALRTLARAPLLSQVRSLELSGDSFTFVGWTALVTSPFLSSLEVLDVNCGDVGVGGARALAESAARKTLVNLSLRYVHLGDEGLAQLLAVEFPRLTRLSVVYNELGPRSVDALLKIPWIDRLELLDLSENDLGEGPVQRLRSRFGERVIV